MRGTVVDNKTGELLEEVVYYTNEERERYRQYLEQKKEYEYKGAMINSEYNKHGCFTWLIYHSQQVLDLGITPDQLTKLIYLSTFIDYNNRLMIDKDKHMTREDMQEVLKVRERTFKTFWSAMIKTKILIVDSYNKSLYLNESLFRRGTIEINEDENKIRLYYKGVRALYEKAKLTEHKFLSYLFQAIPFINRDYNIISHNPFESDIELVQPMQMSEYCRIINYDYDNARKLKGKMKALTVNGKHVFSFVDNGNGLFCFVNPLVYYAGNRWDEVEVLAKF